jgi:Carboxypeptidase regulatory-like domain
MRRMMLGLLVFLLASVLAAVTAGAQTQTGTIEGKVTDPQGAVLPGVTVTLTGPRGAQSVVTDADGTYRFVGVQPWPSYSLKSELSGFLAQEVQTVAVGMGTTATVDFALKLAGVSETVDVRATASAIDVKSAATDTRLSPQMLTQMPIYDATSTLLLNYLPGINNQSAYGAQGVYGNALLLDGVDTRDPEGGSAWTFFNQSLIQEIQVGGLGSPAEYGGFTGAVINTVTKSGGNAYSGLFSIRYTNDSLASENVSAAVVAQNPGLGDPAITKKLVDYTVQVGGPIKRDKAFFFGSVQRYSTRQDPTGPRTIRTDVSPRFNVKFTLQPTTSDTIILGTQYDQYNVTGRVGYWPTAQAGDRQTVSEDAPEWVWNAQWRKVMGTSALFEAKFTGYTGYYYLDPVDPSPFTYDVDTDEYFGGGGGQYYADRSRNQLQVALTKYADKFGKHSLKFGAEIERSHVRSQYQPYGPAGFYIQQYSGVPYYQVSGGSYGYDVQGDNRRFTAYAQDQWNAGRMTLNIGLRLDHIRGYSPVLKENVYKPGLAWGPRIGAAYDLTGKGTSVVKAFWGRYFEGAASLFYTQATPGAVDTFYTPINANGSLGTPFLVLPGIVYGISDDINHSHTDEFNVSYEKQLTNTLKFTATGIWRNTGDFINNVINGSLWSPITLTNPLTNQPFTAYRWANSAATNENFFIRNPEGFEYRATDGSLIGVADPKRNYKGLMLLLDQSFRSRLGYQVSYVLSKAEGTVDNGTGNTSGGASYLAGYQWNSPNAALINTFGELTNSNRHEIKAYVSYELPRADVLIAGIYTGVSGRPYTPYLQPGSSTVGLPAPGSRRQILLEPRGSRQNDFYNNVDLRLEKVFNFQGHRFGGYVDIANLFNTASVITRQYRVPSTTILGKTVLFNAPTAIQTARQVAFGGRWSF